MGFILGKAVIDSFYWPKLQAFVLAGLTSEGVFMRRLRGGITRMAPRAGLKGILYFYFIESAEMIGQMGTNA